MSRIGQTRHFMLLALIPIVMLTGLISVNSLGKIRMDSLPVAIQNLCVLEDLQKTCLVTMGAFAGSIIGLLFRIEEDAEFAKRNLTRRISYMVVSLLVSSCWTPYLLMRFSADQGKALCLAAGMGISLSAWILLEIFYTRIKGIVTWMLDKLPLPKDTNNAAATTDKAKNPPAS